MKNFNNMPDDEKTQLLGELVDVLTKYELSVGESIKPLLSLIATAYATEGRTLDAIIVSGEEIRMLQRGSVKNPAYKGKGSN